MIPVAEYRSRTVAVFGLGRSGLAAVEALAAGGADVLADDDRADRRAAAAALGARAAEMTPDAIAGADALVLSPGVPPDHRVPAAARRAGVAVMGETDLFARAVRGGAAAGPRVVGVTGTNGKSTATALAGRLLAGAGRAVRVGGNIGTAALALEPLGANGIYVLEMSSFQLELASNPAFDVAGLLNVSPDHLDRHGGMDAYIAAKKRIFRGQTAACAAVVARDDRISAAILDEVARTGRARTIAVSGSGAVEGGVGVAGGRLVDGLDGPPRPVADLDRNPALAGAHNRQNAALAYAMCRALGLEADELAAGFAGFRGLPHRLEPVAEISGVRYVNDSKATNPAAAARALACFDAVHWIAGGRAKDADMRPLAPWLGRVRRAYLIGEAADSLAESLPPGVETAMCGALDRAVALASRDAAADGGEGAVVLLSPACASHDQFRDFEARGDRFRALVEALAEGGT